MLLAMSLMRQNRQERLLLFGTRYFPASLSREAVVGLSKLGDDTATLLRWAMSRTNANADRSAYTAMGALDVLEQESRKSAEVLVRQILQMGVGPSRGRGASGDHGPRRSPGRAGSGCHAAESCAVRREATASSMDPRPAGSPVAAGADGDSLFLGPADGPLDVLRWRCTSAAVWQAGIVPLWNPYVYGGMPLLGHPDWGVLYPFNLWLGAAPPLLFLAWNRLFT